MRELLGPIAGLLTASMVLVGCFSVHKRAWPTDDGLVFQDIGEYEVHDTGGYAGPVEVEVPPEAKSALVHCSDYGEGAFAAVWTLKGPDGETIYDADVNKETSPFRSEFLDDVVPVIMPPSPELPLRPGTWSFNYWVGKNNTGTFKCGVVFRTDEPRKKPVLGIELIFVGLSDVDAKKAPHDKGFRQFLKQLDRDLGSAGITPSYKFKDFDGDTTKYTVVDITDTDMSEFNALIRTGNPNPETKRSLSMFLVREIANHTAGGSTILGLSAGPPGSGPVHGVSKAGIVISAADITHAPHEVARIAAHEMGHYLGLYHTTEKDGSQADLIVDTPVCDQDHNGNGVMNSHECKQHGADNTMWWTIGADMNSPLFTKEQSWVLRHNPVVQ